MAEQIRGTAEERRKPVSRRRAWIPVQARTGPAFWRPVPTARGDRRNLCGQTRVWISGERPTRNSPGSTQRLWTLLVPFASVSQLKEKFSQGKVPDRPDVRGGSGEYICACLARNGALSICLFVNSLSEVMENQGLAPGKRATLLKGKWCPIQDSILAQNGSGSRSLP